MPVVELPSVLLAFLLVGIVVGYCVFLAFRISVHQNKFEWSGALAVITSLAGGGFLSYWSEPRNFAAYGIGFFVGFAFYWRSLQSASARTGSRAADTRDSPTTPESQANSDADWDFPSSRVPLGSGSSRGSARPLLLPEDANVLIRIISDSTVPTERRVRALLALRTDIPPEEITLTSSFENLGLSGVEVLFIPLMLRLTFSSEPKLFELKTVKDVVDYLDSRPD
jgi:hypothetical protein